MYPGSCLCGAVRFTLAGALTGARFCHCSHCRKFAGTSPAVWAMARREDVHFHKPEPALTRYNSGKGLRGFCTICGSPVWFESLDFPEMVAIPLGVLDGDDLPLPDMHIWLKQKALWCSVQDELPKFDGNPE